MANCSYSRCEQERRFIKRELQKWTKNMVYIVGLERVAEELMGRRKWKLYQEIIANSHLNSNTATTTTITNTTETVINNGQSPPQLHHLLTKEKESTTPQNIIENRPKENEVVTIKSEQNNINPQSICASDIGQAEATCLPINKKTKIEQNHCSNSVAHEGLPTPIDWKPQDKCYFCVDGKLLTVNDRGDLVAESGTVQTEPDLANRTTIESDSDSSECSDSEPTSATVQGSTTKTVADLLRHSLPQQNMTSFESMAAQLATIASLNGFPPMYPGILYNPFVHQMHSTPTEPIASISPNAKPSPPVSNETSTEQPLDLSAKPTNTSNYIQHDPKQVFRAKPRMSTVAGRRTYTEEELQNALQDILSGKLGTRRAAVLYGIPRSTLRNKVYKLAMEQKREASLLPQTSVLDLDQDEEEKELSGDDDKDIEKSIGSSILSPENLLRLSSAAGQSTIAPGSVSKFGSSYDVRSDISDKEQSKPQSLTPSPQTPPLATNPWLDPLVIQNFLLAGGLMQHKYDDPAFQELFRNLFIKQQELIKEQMKNSAGVTSDHLNNGKPSSTPDTRHLMHNLSLLQHQQHQLQNQVMKSETPDTASSADANDANDDAVILRIPSFKPIAGPSSSSTKNGDSASDKTPQTTSPLLSQSPQGHLSGISPPIMRPSSQSPPVNVGSKGILSLRDVIAKSITRTFNQSSSDTHTNKVSTELSDQYKRPSISVIKSLGGTDMTRFGSSPNMMSSLNSNNSNNQSSAGGAGGKGTRPKRGKYRNYDRDSLVEAVKAVQRGEMSVHRAGSYYGVPHSTLEYKVKERHLMRPRKREPKPQPLDATSSNSSASVKPSDISASSSAALRSLDKSKSLPGTKPPLTTPPGQFPTTSPNGLKMGIFDPSQLQYAPHLFWPHPPGYTGLPMDFARGAPGTAGAFPANAESFFASQMMQRFQEDAIRQASNSSSLPKSSSGTSSSNQTKGTRELSDGLYDTSSTNGSFLDGIIRHSLDRKAGDIPHAALLDQLVKNNRHSDEGVPTKRPGTPLNFAQTEIKRERASPRSVDTDRDSVERDISKESVENLLKYRDGLTLRLDDKSLRSSVEDVNGNDSPPLPPEVNLAHHISDNDDSS